MVTHWVGKKSTCALSSSAGWPSSGPSRKQRSDQCSSLKDHGLEIDHGKEESGSFEVGTCDKVVWSRMQRPGLKGKGGKPYAKGAHPTPPRKERNWWWPPQGMVYKHPRDSQDRAFTSRSPPFDLHMVGLQQQKWMGISPHTSPVTKRVWISPLRVFSQLPLKNNSLQYHLRLLLNQRGPLDT